MPFPNNLPQQLTSFVGRRREMAEVRRLLSSTRLLTLTGAGGCGKTRLALQVASKLLKEYRDGVWFVDLASLSDPSLVPQAVASALSVREQQGRTLSETLADYLKPRKLLLILDNCEHLVQACASLTDTLLRTCSDLRVLVTSRQSLSVAGETIWRVPSLSVPDHQQNLPVRTLKQYDAVQLFTRRAMLKRESFLVTPENAPAVAQLCCQLEGIPLAIELAAARMNILSLEEIVERLDSRLRLLVSGDQQAPSRHRTLHATIDWSYNLLTNLEQSLLRSLSVFTGGSSLQAIEDVWAGEIDEYEVLDILSGLDDKSLVIREEHAGRSRYRLLETVSQYAWGKAVATHELDLLRTRHRDWCLRLAEQAEPELQGSQQLVWLERLEIERDNLRAALGRADENDNSSEVEATIKLAGALWYFWSIRGYLDEGLHWLNRALHKSTSAKPEARAKILVGTAWLAIGQSDYSTGKKLLEESLSLYRQAAYKPGIAISLRGLARTTFEQGDYESAQTLLEEALQHYRELKDKRGLGVVTGRLGYVVGQQGDFERASLLLREGLAISKELGNRADIANALINLGEVARSKGDYDVARPLYEEALAIDRETKRTSGVAVSLANLGSLALWQGEYDKAEAHLKESLGLLIQLGGEQLSIAQCLTGLAGVCCSDGQMEDAARLLGAADNILTAGCMHPNIADRQNRDQVANLISAKLDEATYARAWTTGQILSVEEAAKVALETVTSSRLPNTASTRAESANADLPGLTHREIEVLKLVATGLSNKELAQQLSVTINTVEFHLRSIYGKLGVATRSAATRFAIENDLV